MKRPRFQVKCSLQSTNYKSSEKKQGNWSCVLQWSLFLPNVLFNYLASLKRTSEMEPKSFLLLTQYVSSHCDGCLRLTLEIGWRMLNPSFTGGWWRCWEVVGGDGNGESEPSHRCLSHCSLCSHIKEHAKTNLLRRSDWKDCKLHQVSAGQHNIPNIWPSVQGWQKQRWIHWSYKLCIDWK